MTLTNGELARIRFACKRLANKYQQAREENSILGMMALTGNMEGIAKMLEIMGIPFANEFDDDAHSYNLMRIKIADPVGPAT